MKTPVMYLPRMLTRRLLKDISKQFAQKAKSLLYQYNQFQSREEYQQSLINDQRSNEILRKRSSIFITDDSVDSYISEKYLWTDIQEWLESPMME